MFETLHAVFFKVNERLTTLS